MKIKLFVALETQYFELRIFHFNSYLYSVTCSFITLTRAFNFATRAFNLVTRAFSLLTLVVEKLFRLIESAVISHYVKFFILHLISSHPREWGFFYYTA